MNHFKKKFNNFVRVYSVVFRWDSPAKNIKGNLFRELIEMYML